MFGTSGSGSQFLPVLGLYIIHLPCDLGEPPSKTGGINIPVLLISHLTCFGQWKVNIKGQNKTKKPDMGFRYVCIVCFGLLSSCHVLGINMPRKLTDPRRRMREAERSRPYLVSPAELLHPIRRLIQEK